MTTIAIAGTRGLLFKPIVDGILSDLFKSKYALPIRALTRDPSSETPIEGVEYVKVDYGSPESLESALAGVDTLVNTIGHKGEEAWNPLADAAVAAGVKLYFPSEFGCDSRTLEAEGITTFLKPKADHAKYARSKGLKTVQLVTGLFQIFIFYGFFGHNFQDGSATFFGDGSQVVAITDLADVGLATASVAYRADVPDTLVIAADSMSLNDTVTLYEKVTGRKLRVSYAEQPPLEPPGEFDPGLATQALSAHPETKTFNFVQESNDYVNPGLWKWKTLEDAFKAL